MAKLHSAVHLVTLSRIVYGFLRIICVWVPLIGYSPSGGWTRAKNLPKCTCTTPLCHNSFVAKKRVDDVLEVWAEKYMISNLIFLYVMYLKPNI